MKNILAAGVDRPADQCAFCDGPTNPLLDLPICAPHAIELYGAMQHLLNERKSDADAMAELTAATDAETAAKFMARAKGFFNQPDPEPIVYYLLIFGTSIKIGFTLDLPTRLRSYPPDAVVLATEPGGRDVESARLSEFANHRIGGREWFDPGPSLIEHINQLRAAEGKPPATVTYRKAG